MSEESPWGAELRIGKVRGVVLTKWQRVWNERFDTPLAVSDVADDEQLTGLHDGISVHDIGLDGRTLADGLAVQRPSGLVGRAVGPRVTAFCTVEDAELPPLVARLWREEGVKAEPSACASVAAARAFCSLSGAEADDALAARGLTRAEIAAGTHVAWLTGGAMMPQEEFAALVEQGDTAPQD